MLVSTTVLIILVLVVITALAFDFTNGFHDTGNAMATSIATGALSPKVAVGLSAVLNLVGAFLSVEVALTVTTDVLHIQDKEHAGALVPGLDAQTALLIVFAGLVGGIIWNLLTWLFGLPSSSSHALFGGLIGAGLGATAIAGLSGAVNWNGVFSKVIIPALFSPFVAGIIAAIGTAAVYAITKTVGENFRTTSFRWGQIGTASLVSLAHGTGDAQKTMGVIALALVAAGQLDAADAKENGLPIWIIVCCAVAIAAGTYMGGWRVIRTLGKGLVEISSPQGMAAEAASAAIIMTSSHAGMALSTTHVATGSILGSGVGKPGAKVRWGVAGRMVTAWLITLPLAGLVGFVSFLIADGISKGTGSALLGGIVIFCILCALSGYIYLHSRKQAVNADSVNDDWDPDNEPVNVGAVGASA